MRPHTPPHGSPTPPAPRSQPAPADTPHARIARGSTAPVPHRTSTARHIVLELSRAKRADVADVEPRDLESYQVRTETGGRDAFSLDWRTWRTLLDRLDAGECDAELLRDVGTRLREAMANTPLVRSEHAIIEANRANERVTITIRTAASELAQLPWELLVLEPTGQHLAELESVVLRYTAPSSPPPPLRDERLRNQTGRVVLAYAGHLGVAAADHIEAIAGAHAPFDFDRKRDVMAQLSPRRLRDALDDARATGVPISVLHILCHGTRRRDNTYALVWAGDGDQAEVDVDAADLSRILGSHADQLRMVVLSACHGGNAGALGNHLGGVAQGLHKLGIETVIASRYALGMDNAGLFARVFYRALLGQPVSVETALLAARRELALDAGNRDWASLQLHARPTDDDDTDGDTRPVSINPFRGLLSFRKEHTRFFFGRGREHAEALADLDVLLASGKPRLLMVVGASGTGKSSLVRAGVLPALAPRFAVHVMTPGNAPLAKLTAVLARSRGEALPLLLAVDQLEEIFTHVSDVEQRRAFMARLWELSTAPNGPVVVATLRVDFLGRCGEIRLGDAELGLDELAYDEAHRVFVAQMRRDALREAIEQPARAVGLVFDPGLAERILTDVADEPGALPLLQHTLHHLWLHRDGRRLSAAVYDELGGVCGALEHHANATFDNLDDDQREQARRVLVRMVSADRQTRESRQRVAAAALAPAIDRARAPFEAAVAQLVQARLLVWDDEAGEPTLEVAHEALIRRWSTLQRWLDEDRDMLAELRQIELWAAEYEDRGTLLTPQQLGYAVSVLARYPEGPSPSAQALVAESTRYREGKARRRKWRIVAALGLWSTVTVVFVALGLFALRARNEAQRRLDEVAELSVTLLYLSDTHLSQVSNTADERAQLLNVLRPRLQELFEDDPSNANISQAYARALLQQGDLAMTYAKYVPPTDRERPVQTATGAAAHPCDAPRSATRASPTAEHAAPWYAAACRIASAAGHEREVARAYYSLGNVERERGNLDAAAARFSFAAESQRGLLRADHSDDIARDLMSTYLRLGHLESERNGAATRHYTRALALSATLDGVVAAGRTRTAIDNYRGDLAHNAGDCAGAIELWDAALTNSHALEWDAPGHKGLARDRLVSLDRLCEVYTAQGEFSLADKHCGQAKRISTQLLELNPQDRDLIAGHARTLANWHRLMQATGAQGGDEAVDLAAPTRGVSVAPGQYGAIKRDDDTCRVTPPKRSAPTEDATTQTTQTRAPTAPTAESEKRPVQGPTGDKPKADPKGLPAELE